MSNQNALHDDNKWPAMTAHTGTAGTAETVRVVATEDGALRVDLVSGDTINIGTLNLGTIDLLKAGTITALANGTIGAGTLNTLGTVSKLLSGSVAVVAGTGIITSGSMAVTAGTIYGTVTNIDEDYAIRVDEENSGTTYYGFALPVNGGSPAEAVWKIMRKTYSATAALYGYADNDKNFDNIWNNRTSLTYPS